MRLILAGIESVMSKGVALRQGLSSTASQHSVPVDDCRMLFRSAECQLRCPSSRGTVIVSGQTKEQP